MSKLYIFISNLLLNNIFQVSFASIFFVDPSNDLGITFHIQDYRSLAIKFPRVESFSTAAKSNGPKFSLTETITFYSNELNCMLLGLSFFYSD